MSDEHDFSVKLPAPEIAESPMDDLSMFAAAVISLR
jgi:hypothetical protein